MWTMGNSTVVFYLGKAQLQFGGLQAGEEIFCLLCYHSCLSKDVRKLGAELRTSPLYILLHLFG